MTSGKDGALVITIPAVYQFNENPGGRWTAQRCAGAAGRPSIDRPCVFVEASPNSSEQDVLRRRETPLALRHAMGAPDRVRTLLRRVGAIERAMALHEVRDPRASLDIVATRAARSARSPRLLGPGHAAVDGLQRVRVQREVNDLGSPS